MVREREKQTHTHTHPNTQDTHTHTDASKVNLFDGIGNCVVRVAALLRAEMDGHRQLLSVILSVDQSPWEPSLLLTHFHASRPAPPRTGRGQPRRERGTDDRERERQGRRGELRVDEQKE